LYQRAAARFGVDRMVDDYLRVYEAILARPRSGSGQLWRSEANSSSIGK